MGTITAFHLLPSALLAGAMAVALGCADTTASDKAQPDRTRGHSSNPDPTTPSPPSSPNDNSAATPPRSGDTLSAAADVEVFAALLIQRQQVEFGLLSTTTYFCSSPDPLNTDTGNGSMTIAIDDMDPAGQSTGDSFAITYDQCAQFGGTYSGGSTFKIDEISGTPYAPSPQVWRVTTSHASDVGIEHDSGPTQVTSSFRFSSGTSNGVAYDRAIKGSFDVTTGAAATLTTAYDNSYAWNLGTNLFMQSVNSSFTSTYGNFRLDTLAPVSGIIGATPTEGKARITQSFSTTTLVTTYTVMTDGMVSVELDVNGDGTVDAAYQLPWRSSPMGGYFI